MQAALKNKDKRISKFIKNSQNTNTNTQEMPIYQTIQNNDFYFSCFENFIKLEQYATVNSSFNCFCKILIPFQTINECANIISERINTKPRISKCILYGNKAYKFIFDNNFILNYEKKYIQYIDKFLQHMKNQDCETFIVCHGEKKYLGYVFNDSDKKVAVFFYDFEDCVVATETFFFPSIFFKKEEIFIVHGRFFQKSPEENRAIFDKVVTASFFAGYYFKHAVFYKPNENYVENFTVVSLIEFGDDFFEPGFFSNTETCVYFIFEKKV